MSSPSDLPEIPARIGDSGTAKAFNENVALLSAELWSKFGNGIVTTGQNADSSYSADQDIGKILNGFSIKDRPFEKPDPLQDGGNNVINRILEAAGKGLGEPKYSKTDESNGATTYDENGYIKTTRGDNGCAASVANVLEAAGIRLPKETPLVAVNELYKALTEKMKWTVPPVKDQSDLKPGDIIFLYANGNLNHVAIVGPPGADGKPTFYSNEAGPNGACIWKQVDADQLGLGKSYDPIGPGFKTQVVRPPS